MKRNYLWLVAFIMSVAVLAVIVYTSLYTQVSTNKRDPGADAEGFRIDLPQTFEVWKSGVGPMLIERIPKAKQTTTNLKTLLYHVQAVGWNKREIIAKSKENKSYDLLKTGIDGEGYALIKLQTGDRWWYATLKALKQKHPEARHIQVRPLNRYHWLAPNSEQSSIKSNPVITSRVFTNMETEH